MLSFIKLSIFILTTFAKAQETYVVQTEDFKLHFITNKVETHQLNFEQPLNVIEDGRNELKETERNLITKFDKKMSELHLNRENSIQKANRIDQIFTTTDGIINFFGEHIFIEDVIIHPMVKQGIYMSASQEHIPAMVNNTIIITAITKLYLLDFYNYTSRSIKFTQLLYLYEMYKNIPRKDNEIYLNQKWWSFDSRITGIYVLKEKDGFNFMLKVVGKSDVALYKHKIHKNKSGKIPHIVLLVLMFSSIIYFNRNTKYELCVLKNKLYTGKFIKKNCLIYKVTHTFLEEHKRVYGNLKHGTLVNILNENEGFFFPYIITERTTQFKSITENVNSQDKIGSSSESLSCDNDSTVKISNFFNKEATSTQNLSSEAYKTFSDFFNTRVYDEIQQAEKNKVKKVLYLIIEGIEYLHSKNIIHGRLCPENIRLSEHKEIKIQNIFENNGWRSVKQIRNVKNKEYLNDCFDDLFSLGCLLHYYLAGYHPFDLRKFTKKERKSFRMDSFNNKKEAVEEQSVENTEYKPPVVSHIFQHSSKKTSLFDRIYNFISYLSVSFNYLTASINPVFISSIIFRKKSIQTYPHIYEKILSEETAKYIEYNILYNTYKIRLDDQVEHDLVYHCIKSPLTQTKLSLLCHPYFWDNARCLEFICDTSDFIETNPTFKSRLEKSKKIVFNGSWMDLLDPMMIRSVSVKRTYDQQSLCDLIRFIRNCHRHYQELKNNELFEVLEGKLFVYFSHIFPELLMFLYRSSILKNQPFLMKYYE